MSGQLFHVGHIKPKRTIRITGYRLWTAWCGKCRAYRFLLNVRKWLGWPEANAPVGGQCIACRSYVSIHSAAPSTPENVA